ncbi:MAG: hypothetical protein B7Y45_02680 [Sphingomonas sp. 28-66-16]|nr:MAG: hypothetical protein B7Y45_02680 [Sphingomonas sp. 28-66-16]
MRSILVLADSGPAAEQRLQAALDIARLTDGHVTLHVNTPLQRFVSMDPFGGSYVMEGALAEEQAREDRLVEALTAKLSSENVPWDITTGAGMPANDLIAAAPLADLIVLSLTPPDSPAAADTTMLVGDVAVSASCPVLAIPAAEKPLFVTGTAMIAWNGGAEAANALRAAVPLLALAGEVKLVTITNRPEELPAIDALQYLSRHGIHAELVVRPHEHQRIAEALEEAADAVGADWIAMGAYGHSRMREMVFGGVTHHFLNSAKFPLLLSH